MSFQPPGAWATPQPVGPAPLDQPQYNATIGQAASRFWRKFATFTGRASRSEYWWWFLISSGVSIVLQIAGSLTLGGTLFRATSTNPFGDLRTFLLPLIPSLVWTVVALVPSIALTIRRLHDGNRRGWWYLLVLPSLVGGVVQLVGFASVDPERMAVGDLSGLAIVPLVIGGLLSLIGLVGSIVVLVFLIMGPDPRGARFDRRS